MTTKPPLEVKASIQARSLDDFDYRPTLADIEQAYILQRLAQNQGNKPATAKELGISLKTLYNKLNRYAQAQPS